MVLSAHDPVVFTIAASASSGTATVNLGGLSLCGIYISTNVHSGTSITFTAAPYSSGTYAALRTSTGNSVSITGISTQSAGLYNISPINFLPTQFVKVVSSATSEQTNYVILARPLT